MQKLVIKPYLHADASTETGLDADDAASLTDESHHEVDLRFTKVFSDEATSASDASKDHTATGDDAFEILGDAPTSE